MKKFILILAALFAVGVTACGGGPKSEEDQVRDAWLGFAHSVRDDDGKCLSYLADHSQPIVLSMLGGCDGLHDVYESAKADGEVERFKAKDVEVVITGNKAVATPPKSSGDEPSILRKENARWKLSMEDAGQDA